MCLICVGFSNWVSLLPGVCMCVRALECVQACLRKRGDSSCTYTLTGASASSI